MELFTLFLTVALVHLLAVVTPGPDFLMLTCNALRYGRRAGFWTAAGIGIAIFVHVAYSVVGIGLLISQSVFLFSVLKFAGAAYLMYVGVQCLMAKKEAPEAISVKGMEKLKTDTGAFMDGFLCNVLNPKATLFFLSLFTVVIDVTTPVWIQVLLGVWMALATFVWFAVLSGLVSLASVRQRMHRIQHWMLKAMGGALVLLGLKLATTRMN